MRAFNQGREAAKRAAGPPTDPAAVAAALGVEVVRWPFSGRILEVVLEGVVALQQGLAPAWERWLIAHALGHHLLHTGAAFHLDGWQWVSRFKAERQAEEFAAGLFAPPGGVDAERSRRPGATAAVAGAEGGVCAAAVAEGGRREG